MWFMDIPVHHLLTVYYCIKVFFRYTKFYSVTTMLAELNLHNFDSLIDKCRSDFKRHIHACGNDILQHFVCLNLIDSMLLGYVTVLLLYSYYFLLFLLFYFLHFFIILCFYVLWAYA